ncbi:SDR family NAD(P)-dependent oxidoreductase [Paraburkholderia translucens]|uniref:SDR family NAD(P)-dependent oxidoreductase n=1 Tax=Paraburkholderia translucens TaxID=2886945 RepID=UPI003CE55702
MLIKDKVGLITGAGSGMGMAAALEFAREGATVVLSGRTEDKLLSVRDLIVSQRAVRKSISLMQPRERPTKPWVERRGRRFAMARPFTCRTLELPRQISAVSTEGETCELPANLADHAAR